MSLSLGKKGGNTTTVFTESWIADGHDQPLKDFEKTDVNDHSHNHLHFLYI